MPQKNPAVDAYIARPHDDARPILEKIRTAFHKGCPELVEVMKWSTPHFEHQGLLGGMAAFKHHVGFGFWRGKELSDPEGILGGQGGSMCTAKCTSVKDLPPQKVLVAYVKEAAALNASGRSTPKPAKSAKAAPVRAPKDLADALKQKQHARAKATFAALPPSGRRDYVEWLTEAKQPATRARRLATALEWMAEGKSRHWKYRKGGK